MAQVCYWDVRNSQTRSPSDVRSFLPLWWATYFQRCTTAKRGLFLRLVRSCSPRVSLRLLVALLLADYSGLAVHCALMCLIVNRLGNPPTGASLCSDGTPLHRGFRAIRARASRASVSKLVCGAQGTCSLGTTPLPAYKETPCQGSSRRSLSRTPDS